MNKHTKRKLQRSMQRDMGNTRLFQGCLQLASKPNYGLQLKMEQRCILDGFTLFSLCRFIKKCRLPGYIVSGPYKGPLVI